MLSIIEIIVMLYIIFQAEFKIFMEVMIIYTISFFSRISPS